ncbi:2-hydroxyacid dehydrogenase [Lacisediminihabitans sp. FW035]
MSHAPFRVAITADAASPDGSTSFGDIGLDRLASHGVEWEVLPRYVDPLPADDLRGYHAVLSLGHTTFGEELVKDLPDLRLIARFGAGVDSIDVDACTRAGIAVTNTPDGVRRPLALAALTLVLSLAHNLPAKDRLVRTGNWADRSRFRGHGVDGKVLGIIGFGSVGADLAALAQGLGFTVIGSNRSSRHPEASRLGVELLEVDAVVAAADYLVLTASLNEQSRGMIDGRRLGLMKPTAFLINVGRGALVDHASLVSVLRARTIAGAGLDVFDPEPIDPSDELVGFDSVILSPHSLPHTEEFTRDVARSALDAIIAISEKRAPRYLLNPEVLHSDSWARKTAVSPGD